MIPKHSFITSTDSGLPDALKTPPHCHPLDLSNHSLGKVLIVVAFVKRKIEGGSKVIKVLSKITQQVNGRAGAEVWHWDFQV